jgi:hypothetical protein
MVHHGLFRQDETWLRKGIVRTAGGVRHGQDEKNAGFLRDCRDQPCRGADSHSVRPRLYQCDLDLQCEHAQYRILVTFRGVTAESGAQR